MRPLSFSYSLQRICKQTFLTFPLSPQMDHISVTETALHHQPLPPGSFQWPLIGLSDSLPAIPHLPQCSIQLELKDQNTSHSLHHLAGSPPMISTSLGIKPGCSYHLLPPCSTLYFLRSVLAQWTPTSFLKCPLLSEAFPDPATQISDPPLQYFLPPFLIYFNLKDSSSSDKLHTLPLCLCIVCSPLTRMHVLWGQGFSFGLLIALILVFIVQPGIK